jgi:hypothetical protein
VVLGFSLSRGLSSTIGGSSITITRQSILLVSLGNSFTCLLILEFGFAIIGAPTVCSLLL